MIGQVYDWLPIEAATSEGVQAKIAQAVANWSARWFARRAISVASVKSAAAELRSDSDGSGGWRLYRHGVAISCSKRGASRIVGSALDARIESFELTEVDRGLLDALQREIIEDLAVKIEAALGLRGAPVQRSQPAPEPVSIRDPFGRLGGVTVSLAEGQGAEILSVAIPLAAILPLCRSALPPRRSAAVRLDTLSMALGPITVTIEATLGSANIPLLDMQGLAPGDILVLDRALDEALEVSSPGSDHIFARARLVDTDGQMALAFQDRF